MKLTKTPTPLSGAFLIQPQVLGDERGFFMETWSRRDFAAAELDLNFVQDNHSRSARGVLRGLHYQDSSAPIGKLVRCTRGRIFDVAVDLRAGSPTLGRWFGTELTEDNKAQLWVPVGFAHGFVTISDVAEVQYRQTGYYTPDAEHVIAWNDPDLAIDWPLRDPTLSRRDRSGMSFQEYLAKPHFR
jgi:dTDP-4-dehydrorhamnose 3,5-epimerase